MVKDIRSKDWIGTSYRDSFQLPSNLGYGVYQWEKCPKTDRIHAQFFLRFIERKRFSQIRKLLPGDHVEVAHDPDAARAYCVKESTRHRLGEEIGVWDCSALPITGLLKKRKVKEVLEARPTLWRSVGVMSQIRAMVRECRDHLTEGWFLTGRTGTGKTRTSNLISKYLGDCFWQDGSQWWNGYDGETLVVIDEYRGQFPVNFLLRLLDRTPFMVPIKGGYSQFTSKVVIFCSNLGLDNICKDLDCLSKDAVKRRFQVIKEFW